ncbi:MAG: TlpA family protein disulfide reductase [Bacteroidales bacterium]
MHINKVLLLLTYGVMLSCVTQRNEDYSVPKTTVISGKIDNIDPNNPVVTMHVNRLGLGSLALSAKADSAGNFSASFPLYIPSDVWVRYKINFLVLVKPGDSVHIRFDGTPNDRPKILETIQFSGNHSRENQDAAKFQYRYFSSPLYYDWDAKERANKNYNLNEFILYLDTMKQQSNQLYQRFVDEAKPGEFVRNWAKEYLEADYYDALALYPDDHRRLNNLKYNEVQVPSSYYDTLLQRLPIERERLISGYALSGFINRFHYKYVRTQMSQDEANKGYVFPGYMAGSPEILDSLLLFGVIKHTPDTLLRQMVLTELFHQKFEKSEIGLFEKYINIAEQYIVEPFLREPLFEHYTELKNRLENPVMATEALLKKFEGSSARQLYDSITAQNKGKVIYLDCWATWCGPCKVEMPNSKRLMEDMKGEKVAFAFVCIDSEENLWKANLSELQLGGQHYFLTKEQSVDWRKAFGIQGIPFYMIISPDGVIVEKGSHLRPNQVKGKLTELLAP